VRSHRELYPQQYEHPLVGKLVEFEWHGARTRGVVERTMQTRFGLLVSIDTLPVGTALLACAVKEVARG
jgi:hypothetical protein